jgi:hypothetical protein
VKLTLVRRLDYIKIYHKEMGCEGADWIEVTQWRALVNALMNILIKKKMMNFLTNSLTA